MSSYNKASIGRDRARLLDWYKTEKRNLPWRKSRNPYFIWLSEVMLQQTTVKAVIPYFEKFTKRFPNIETLAKSSIEDVYEYWSGLGYYSRARSLLKAAQVLTKLKTFPNNYRDLLELPGLGDYTARAIASIAFDEKVGVVDGNVIRVLSRRWNQPWEHWKTKEKHQIQDLSDLYSSEGQSREINQAIMELGATLCRPKNPTCLLCPWKTSCKALKQDNQLALPLKKPRRSKEIWQWKAILMTKGSQIAIVENQYAPFLKKQWILPGQVQKKTFTPKKFDFKHGITHHEIFVTLTRERSNFLKDSNQKVLWVTPKQLKQKVPFSIVQKAVALGLDDRGKK